MTKELLSEVLGTEVTEILLWKCTNDTIAYKIKNTLTHQFININKLANMIKDQ